MLTIHLRITDATTKRPTPVRLRIADAAGNHYMPFGRLAAFPTGVGEQVGGHLQLGKELFTIINGSCEIALPAGVPLRIQASKGPEYEILDRTVTLGAGQMALRFEMTRWIDTVKDGWISGDSRTHFLTPHDALLEAAAEDISVVNLLARWHTMLARDGNTYATLTNLAAFSGQNAAIVADGRQVVVNTLNSHRALGRVALLHAHRAIYPIAYGDPESTDDWSLCDWCDQCHRKKGLTVWVDAFRADAGLLGGEALVALILGKIDAIEVDAQPRLQPLVPWLYHLWNAGFAVPLIGGSGKDNNRVPLGAMRTYAKVDGESTYATWIDAVRAGRTYVTTGPIVEFTISHEASSKMVGIHADVQSMALFDKLEILLDGEVISTVPATHDRLFTANAELQHPFAKSGWLAARCIGTNGAFAHTSPVVVNIEGQPLTRRASSLAALRRCVEQTREWAVERGTYIDERWRQKLLENCDAALTRIVMPESRPV